MNPENTANVREIAEKGLTDLIVELLSTTLTSDGTLEAVCNLTHLPPLLLPIFRPV